MAGKNRRSYMWLAVFCAGMAAGTVLVNEMIRASVMDTSVLTAYIRGLTKKPFGDIYFFLYLCINRLASFFVMLVLALAFRTSAIFIAMTTGLGVALGSIVSLAAMTYGYGGILMAAALLFPQYMIYVPIYIFLLKMVDNNKYNGTIEHTSVNRSKHRMTAVLTAFAALVVLGSAMESYVNPLIVEKIEKFF